MSWRDERAAKQNYLWQQYFCFVMWCVDRRLPRVAREWCEVKLSIPLKSTRVQSVGWSYFQTLKSAHRLKENLLHSNRPIALFSLRLVCFLVKYFSLHTLTFQTTVNNNREVSSCKPFSHFFVSKIIKKLCFDDKVNRIECPASETNWLIWRNLGFSALRFSIFPLKALPSVR